MVGGMGSNATGSTERMNQTRVVTLLANSNDV